MQAPELLNQAQRSSAQPHNTFVPPAPAPPQASSSAAASGGADGGSGAGSSSGASGGADNASGGAGNESGDSFGGGGGGGGGSTKSTRNMARFPSTFPPNAVSSQLSTSPSSSGARPLAPRHRRAAAANAAAGRAAADTQGHGRGSHRDAPLATNTSYSSAVDIWALGVFTFRVLTGSMPFAFTTVRNLLLELPQRRAGLKVPRYLSLLAASFMHTSLSDAAAARPTAAQLLAHPWIVSCGSTVPADLSAPQWGPLRAPPPPPRSGALCSSGEGSLLQAVASHELLQCPQGLDQAQYDGLCRPRFARQGFYPPDVNAPAATVPDAAAPHAEPAAAVPPRPVSAADGSGSRLSSCSSGSLNSMTADVTTPRRCDSSLLLLS